MWAVVIYLITLACVFVCVCEREKKRERECVCVCVCVQKLPTEVGHWGNHLGG